MIRQLTRPHRHRALSGHPLASGAGSAQIAGVTLSLPDESSPQPASRATPARPPDSLRDRDPLGLLPRRQSSTGTLLIGGLLTALCAGGGLIAVVQVGLSRPADHFTQPVNDRPSVVAPSLAPQPVVACAVDGGIEAAAPNVDRLHRVGLNTR